MVSSNAPTEKRRKRRKNRENTYLNSYRVRRKSEEISMKRRKRKEKKHSNRYRVERREEEKIYKKSKGEQERKRKEKEEECHRMWQPNPAARCLKTFATPSVTEQKSSGDLE